MIHMDTKIIGLVLLICAGLLFYQSYDDFIDSYFSPAAKLQAKIEKDIAQNIHVHHPESESEIRRVVVKYHSEEAHAFFKKHQPKFKINPDGKIWLEIEMIDVPDEENPGILTQTSVFDVKTNNKIGEFGSTYPIKLPRLAKIQIPTIVKNPRNEKSR